MKTYSLWLVVMIAIVASVGCESKQSQQMRAEFVKVGEHYRRIFEERFGDVDWELLKEFESEFPELARQIDKDLIVSWYQDVNADPSNNRQRILAFNLFSAMRGGPVLFLDGSLRHVSAKELDKLRDASADSSKTGSVEMVEVSGRPYVDSPIEGLALALPEGWRWVKATNAYMYDDSKALIHLQLLDADLESAELAVDMSIKRRNAGGVRKAAIKGKQGLYAEFLMQSANPEVPREKVFTILLPRASKTLQISASLPPTCKDASLFPETVLGCHWE
jgi:hypothetical protein